MIHIVLYQPEISPNTGNIIRSCFATNAKLHIIKPIAFELEPRYLKRPAAGKLLSDIEHEIHSNYDEFVKKYGDKKIFYITRYATQTYSDVDFKQIRDNNEDIFLMFGTESTGIPKSILSKNLNTCLRIPMQEKSRSLNLANSVVIVIYEVLRQLNFESLSLYEVQKGKYFLNEAN
ncbi:tRNA (cytidine(34)-2'-O)-methyltransferase [Mesomycoplasma hyorhinis]|uniref:Putative tRNA (cytidine(34)-2'-O)-methyltransferase n=3 Tax=Mesomycoplasma hyorhinis TaxID=2100 RepID=A0ABD6IGZ4_MESHY|nr:tRNA (cytidine(34)-2'-O)-methyltransferase [Mesomycoplasma hyorhinis]AEC45624.1 Putative RNA methyltransferase, TrmH family, group 2 [Mesomycoplasma hyorhinis MCLD]AEX14037.1 RNA methyltransferase, TrmH family [Mesomycoplasma hyorhinis GDL-1]AFX74287.1 tRNA (cytosine34-2'-O-)-methyltransferase [Mesomycoplasma hyorhinis SK76]AHA41027.1 Putative tRNA (cytidine(34)-2'-O)-methyltransferase [Mesomycoplasma hyorhinis DBS 1050]TRM75874.1 tRNA (cytidine(34)-2'-O)-methyltransferase [Sulfolobus sp. A